MMLRIMIAMLVLIIPQGGFAVGKMDAARFQKVLNLPGNYLAPVEHTTTFFDVMDSSGKPQITFYVPDEESENLQALLSKPGPLEFRVTATPKEGGGCIFSIGIVSVTPVLTKVREMQ